jgi:LysM repeat protein
MPSVRGQEYYRIAILVLCGQAFAAAATGELVTHVVRPGDTLSGIALKYYGDARLWDRIVGANSLPTPDRLREGQRLVIPDGGAPQNPSPAPAVTSSYSVAEGPPLAGPDSLAGPAPTARPVLSPRTPLDSEALRGLAAAAVVGHYTNLNLSEFDPGYLVRLESPTLAAGPRVVVSWLGRAALSLEQGATRDLDRKQVLKLEVWLTEDGRVLKVGDRRVWLNRNGGTDSPP